MKIHITAEAKDGSRVDLYYYSITEAKKENPALKNFRQVSYKYPL